MTNACPTYPEPSQPSWWIEDADLPARPALDDDLDVDVCVVGAGVTGCTTARTLRAAGAEVALLDARHVASGASGRNGGFLLAGVQMRFPALVETVGTERARSLYGLSIEARDALMDTAAALDLMPEVVTRTDSLRLATSDAELAELRRESALLAEHGFASDFLEAEALADPLAAHFAGGLRVRGDGCMHPARWIGALAAAAEAEGARVFDRSPVTEIHAERDAARAVVHTRGGTRVRAGTVVLATEAWLPGLVPELSGRVVPYRSQVLAASVPGDETLLTMPVWSRRGWDYAQQRPSGMLVAGGEQLEQADLYATWEETTDAGDQAAIESWIRRVLDIAPSIEARWAGVLTMSSDGFPYVGRLPGDGPVYVAGGWGGAGNVLGFAGARLLAGLLTSEDRIPPEWRPSRIA